MHHPDRLEVNDCLPRIQLLNHRGKASDLMRHADGRPMILVFAGGPPDSPAERFLEKLAAESVSIEARAHLLILNADSQSENAARAERLGLPFPILSDSEAKALSLLGPLSTESSEPTDLYARRVSVVVADRNCRVLGIDRDIDQESYLPGLIRLLDTLDREPGQVVRPKAPVLYVPRVLDPDDRRRLMDLYETGGNSPTGVFYSPTDTAGGTLDSEAKRRRDHVITEAAVANDLGVVIGKRVVPEIFKAFGFRVKYVKEFKIGCYDADSEGFFRPHRDNFAEVGGRRFAMSLNLNTGDYEGGSLRFPEFGPDLYSPAAGDAIVFSCFLVHEALPVTRGRRFVLLTFFYGEEGESREHRLPAA